MRPRFGLCLPSASFSTGPGQQGESGHLSSPAAPPRQARAPAARACLHRSDPVRAAMRRRLSAIVVAASALVCATNGALACAVCIERPATTLADRLIGADAVVLMREDPDRRLRYKAITTLKGDTDAPPQFLVDSATRARLADKPHEAVLALRDAAGWSLAGYATLARIETTQAILERAEHWTASPAARLAFFEGRLSHTELDLRLLALDEVARAPYSLVRRMRVPLDGDTILKALADPQLGDYASVHILMLGLSPRETDRATIRAAAVRRSGAALAAWATALIEADGAEGVARLVQAWIEPAGRDKEDLAQVVSAFEIHAREGDPDLGPALRSPLLALADSRPDLAGPVVRALIALDDFTAAPLFAKHLDRDGTLSEADTLMATAYVDAGRSAMRRVLLRAAIAPKTAP